MGRRKISIAPISDDRNRSVTFLKRKNGLFKKAYELGILCSADVAVVVFSNNGKLFEFASGDMDNILLRYSHYNGPAHEKRGPGDYATKDVEVIAARGLGGKMTRLSDADVEEEDFDEEYEEEEPLDSSGDERKPSAVAKGAPGKGKKNPRASTSRAGQGIARRDSVSQGSEMSLGHQSMQPQSSNEASPHLGTNALPSHGGFQFANNHPPHLQDPRNNGMQGGPPPSFQFGFPPQQGYNPYMHSSASMPSLGGWSPYAPMPNQMAVGPGGRPPPPGWPFASSQPGAQGQQLAPGPHWLTASQASGQVFGDVSGAYPPPMAALQAAYHQSQQLHFPPDSNVQEYTPSQPAAMPAPASGTYSANAQFPSTSHPAQHPSHIVASPNPSLPGRQTPSRRGTGASVEGGVGPASDAGGPVTMMTDPRPSSVASASRSDSERRSGGGLSRSNSNSQKPRLSVNIPDEGGPGKRGGGSGGSTIPGANTVAVAEEHGPFTAEPDDIEEEPEPMTAQPFSGGSARFAADLLPSPSAFLNDYAGSFSGLNTAIAIANDEERGSVFSWPKAVTYSPPRDNAGESSSSAALSNARHDLFGETAASTALRSLKRGNDELVSPIAAPSAQERMDLDSSGKESAEEGSVKKLRHAAQ